MNPSTRYDRTIRVVMWLDAFLSTAMVAVCLVVCPVVAALGLPQVLRFALGVAAGVSAVLLAAFGTITAVLLMLRMRAGQYALPAGLRLPLPTGMSPELITADSAPARDRELTSVR